MATLMEKDVLIEMVASCFALVTRNMDYEEYSNSPECDRLIDLRKYLYSTDEDQINYEQVLNECKAIQSKWETA